MTNKEFDMRNMFGFSIADIDIESLSDDDKLSAIEFLAEQVKAEALAKRNALLKQTDWTQLPDVQADVRDKYKAYRQALRDLTTTNDLSSIYKWEDVVFPEMP